MKTTQYLDAAKRKLGIESDYALAKQLGISTSRMGNYRTGRNLPDPLMCAQIAELLGLDPLRVIADVELERATTPEAADLWKRIAKRAAVVVLGAVGLNAATPPAQASPADAGAVPVYYVKSRRRSLEGFAILQFLRALASSLVAL